MQVTVTQGGNTYNGMAVRVLVLINAAAAQTGATAQVSDWDAVPPQAAITTTAAGSVVYGAIMKAAAGSFTATADTTLLDNIADTVNGSRYGTCKASAPTGTPGAVTIGASAPSSSDSSDVALMEILTDGTDLIEDSSAPDVVSDFNATTVTTAAFDPPDGALLVCLVSSDGGSGGGITMDVSGGGVIWDEVIRNLAGGSDGYAGVWTAVAGAGVNGDPIITCTQGGTSALRGMFVRVLALTGALEAGGVSAGNFTTSAAIPQQSVTPVASNSLIVFGLGSDGIAAEAAEAAGNTYYDNGGDTTDGWAYAHGRYTGTVTAGTPVTAGASANGGSGHSDWAMYEIRPSGGSTPALDASSPPLATTEAAATVNVNQFSPPSGAVLAVIIVAGGNAGGSGMTMTVTSVPAMTWTPRAVSSATDNFQVVFIYTSTVPNYAGAAAVLGGGTGSWAGTGNATGISDSLWATWTAP